MIPFSILIFNATRPTSVGGVRRFAQELVTSIRAKEPSTYELFGTREEGLLKGTITLFRQFNEMIKKVEIVHFIVLSPFNIPFLILAKLYRKRIVTSYHGIYNQEVSLTRRPLVFILHWIADKASRSFSDVIISSSTYLVLTLKLRKNTVVIPYPSNQKTPKEPTGNKKHRHEIIFVTASNFNIQKKSDGIHVLLEAMQQIVREYGFVKLLIFGGGEQLMKFKMMYGQRKNISFMGFRNDFIHFLSSSDGYIHISGLDNQPYSVIDALILGKVIVCNNLEGIMEMMDPKNNFVVQLDPLAVTNGLRSLIEEILYDGNKLEQREERNKSFALKRYSLEAITSEYMKIYNQTL